MWGAPKPIIDVDMLPEFVDRFQDKIEVEAEEENVAHVYGGKIELNVKIANDEDANVEDSWTSIKYSCSSNVDRKDLFELNPRITFQLTSQLKVLAKLNMKQWDDATTSEKVLAQLKLTNSHSFKLIQKVQKVT